MTPEQQTLTILIALRNAIERGVLVFYEANGSNLSARANRFADPNLVFTAQNHLQILLSSFLEEWPRFASRAKDDLDVRETLRQVQPVMNRFKGWRGLQSVRSKLLAHPFRDRSGSAVFTWDVFRESDAPTTFHETLLLGFCALTAVDRVKERHDKEIAQAQKLLESIDRTIPVKGISTTDELEAEFAELQRAMRSTK